MKILLVYPQSPDTFWSFEHLLRFVSRRAAFPPIELAIMGYHFRRVASLL